MQATILTDWLSEIQLFVPRYFGNTQRKISCKLSCRPPIVKVISANGQISFGKQFAVRQVLVEKQETGVWLIRTATVISDNERWLHEA